MKRKALMIMNILCIATLWGCGGSNEKVEQINDTQIENEVVVDIEESAEEETDVTTETIETTEAIETNDSSNEVYIFECTSGNDYIDQLAAANVVIGEGEEVYGQEWVDDTNKCYRVKVQYSDKPDNAYQHNRDYFFFADESIKPVIVDYPDKDQKNADRYAYEACGFEAHFEDVTFDGNDDLIISLGFQSINGSGRNCVYVYDEGQYVYNKSFENIFNYRLDKENKQIIGGYTSANVEQTEVFEYNADKNVFVGIDAEFHIYDVDSLIYRMGKEYYTVSYFEDLYNLVAGCDNAPNMDDKWNRTEVHSSLCSNISITNLSAEGFDYKFESQYFFNTGEVSGHASFASDTVAISKLGDEDYVAFSIEDGIMNVYSSSYEMPGCGQNVSIQGKYVTGEAEYINANMLDNTFTKDQQNIIKEKLATDYYDNFIFSTENGGVTSSEEGATVKVVAVDPTDSHYGYTAIIENEKLVSITFNDGTEFSF